jgi:hypothetical protein
LQQVSDERRRAKEERRRARQIIELPDEQRSPAEEAD